MNTLEENVEHRMKRPIEIWQAIIASLLFLLSVGTIIVQQSDRITSQQEQINFLREKITDNQQAFREMNGNLKEINSRLTEIQVTIVNKQDRK
jgi:septal ring factor EnvC (AmiA/AmiB activator)